MADLNKLSFISLPPQIFFFFFPIITNFNSLLNEIEISKLKVFADAKLDVAQKMGLDFKRIVKYCGRSRKWW